jgi:hypothetical protein
MPSQAEGVQISTTQHVKSLAYCESCDGGLPSAAPRDLTRIGRSNHDTVVDRSASLKLMGCDKAEWVPGERAKERRINSAELEHRGWARTRVPRECVRDRECV